MARTVEGDAASSKMTVVDAQPEPEPEERPIFGDGTDSAWGRVPSSIQREG